MYLYAWDEAKSASNFILRGFDFAFAVRLFDDRTVEHEDARRDYGERRVVAIGVVDGVHLTVIYTDRIIGGMKIRRIISARLSNNRERKEYGDGVQTQGETRPGPS